MKLKSFVTSALFIVSAVLPANTFAAPIPEEVKQNGWAIGVQAYSFNRFPAFEAIERTQTAGAKCIEFYPGQRFSREDPQTTFSHFMSADHIAKIQEKLKQHGVTAVNYGVVSGKDEAEWRKIFEFAKTLNLYAITTEDIDKLDIIEPLVKEFDIKVGIHEHGRRPNKPEYQLWDPHFVLSKVKDRDPRIGACADTGHWQTSGLNPVYCLRVLEGRIISSHLKDKKDYGQSHNVVFGKGVGEIDRCMDELKKQKFEGNISIEHEHNWEANVPEVTQCVEYVRNYKPKE